MVWAKWTAPRWSRKCGQRGKNNQPLPTTTTTAKRERLQTSFQTQCDNNIVATWMSLYWIHTALQLKLSVTVTMAVTVSWQGKRTRPWETCRLLHIWNRMQLSGSECTVSWARQGSWCELISWQLWLEMGMLCWSTGGMHGTAIHCPLCPAARQRLSLAPTSAQKMQHSKLIGPARDVAGGEFEPACLVRGRPLSWHLHEPPPYMQDYGSPGRWSIPACFSWPDTSRLSADGGQITFFWSSGHFL